MNAVRQIRHSRRFPLSKVGECLYRSECGSYFAVVKHLGKQHRKSLQTTNRGIAVKKLGEFRQKLRHLAPAAGNIPAADPVGHTTAQDESGGFVGSVRFDGLVFVNGFLVLTLATVFLRFMGRPPDGSSLLVHLPSGCSSDGGASG